MMRRKSPRRTSAVGTIWSPAIGAMRVLVICMPPKKNSLVADDRAAEGAARLGPLQSIVASQAAVLGAVEIANRVERVMPTEEKAAAAEGVGA